MRPGKDDKVLIGQSERIVDVYTKAKLPVTLYVLEDSGHGGKEFYSGRQRELLVEFLNKHLLPAFHDKPLPRNEAELAKLKQSLAGLKVTDSEE